MCFFFTDIRDEVEACLAEHVCPILWHANLCPFLDGALWHLLLWLHLWEEQYLLDEGLACHQHDQAVDTDTDTRCWRHTVLEGTEEVLIDNHCLVITLVSKLHLVDKTLFLVNWVVELRVCIGKLLTVYHQLETLGQAWLRTVHLGQWRHLYRIVGDEGRLEEGSLAELTEELVNQLTLTHGLIYIHALLLAECADLFLGLAVAVETGLFLDGIEDRQTAIWSLETDDVAINLALWLAVYGDTDRFEQLLCESHHPVVVLVLNIKLHTGKLRVVVAVHTLVAEVLADFINTLEPPYDEALQVKLGSDTHVHILIERIEVGDEWAG